MNAIDRSRSYVARATRLMRKGGMRAQATLSVSVRASDSGQTPEQVRDDFMRCLPLLFPGARVQAWATPEWGDTVFAEVDLAPIDGDDDE